MMSQHSPTQCYMCLAHMTHLFLFEEYSYIASAQLFGELTGVLYSVIRGESMEYIEQLESSINLRKYDDKIC